MDGAPGSHGEGAGPVRKEAAAEVHARGDGGEDGSDAEWRGWRVSGVKPAELGDRLALGVRERNTKVFQVSALY